MLRALLLALALVVAVAVDLPNGIRTTYAFDSADRLTGINHTHGADVLASASYILEDAGNRVSETKSGGNLQTPLAGAQNVMAVADVNGAVTARYRYRAFGERINLTGGSPNRTDPTFQGRTYDQGLGIYDYRNRSFDPATGRFLQRDPVLGGDPLFNPYCFPGNNPVTNMDPMGDMVLHYYTYAAAVQKYCNEHGTPPGFTEVPTVLSIDYFRESSFRVCDGATGQWKVIKATDAQVYKLFGEPTFAPGEYGRIATASYTDRETGAMMLSDIKHIPGDFMKLGEQARKSGDPAFMVDALTKGMMRTAFYPIVAAVEGQKGDPRRHSIDTFNCVAFWGSMLAFGVGGEGGAAAAASRAAGEIELANGVTFVLDVDRALNPAVVGRLAGAAKGTNTAELAFLFRGTSEGFPGGAALQRLGITPASTDPGKATLFAIESSQYGEGVLHIVPRSNLPVGAIGPGNVLARTEAEVGVTMLPTEFAKRAQVTLPVDRARMLLQNIGVETPFMLRSKEQLRAALESAPAMTQEQTQQFLRGALRLEPAPASQGVPR